MGIFDALTGEAQRNFIARPEEAKGLVIYKYPERNIRMMTQLTVQGDEVALFVKDGIVAGKLTAGRHTLDAQNIPFLSRLLEHVTGGNFLMAEVYFVSIREFANQKFGGPIGEMRDPDTSLGIGTMVYGEYSLKVDDAQKLVLGLAGLRSSDNEDFLGWFKSQVLKVTRDRVAELIVKKKWPLLDVTSGAYTEEIEADVIAGMQANVGTYGIQIVRLGNFTITIKAEDEATLKKLTKDTAYTKLAGGFQQYAQGQAMLGAADGMAKGGGAEGGGGGGMAMQGMGMGMGIGMAQAFMPGGQAGGGAGSGGGSQKSVADRLKEIHELKTAGVLSDEEYSAKKAELMKLL